MNLKINLSLVFLLFAGTSLLAQKQKLSIAAYNQPIKQVFDMIQAKSEYYILYSDEVVADSMKVTIKADHLSPLEVLSTILPPKGLAYTLTQKGLIVISPAAGIRRNISKGQPESKLTGLVSDAQGSAVPFASVALFLEEKQIAGVIADENGTFSISSEFRDNYRYSLKVSSIGYHAYTNDFVYPDTSFTRHIRLTEEKNTLKTVTITAKKPLVVRKADRYVINVEDSFLANEESGLDVLRKSPGIWVDNNGSIRIKGNQPVIVMINDVVQRMSQADLAEYLRTLKSENISKIEVISNPPSEFEAAGTGGIIHILLKKARQDGLISSAYVRYRQQEEKPFAGGGLSLDYKLKNFYIFGNAAYSKDKSYYLATTDIAYPDRSLYYSKTDRNNDNERDQYRIGVAYDFSKTQSAGIQTIRTSGELFQTFITNIDYISDISPAAGVSNSEWIRRPVLNSSTLNYSWKIDTLGSSLKFIADYTRSTKTETNNFSSVYNDALRDAEYRNNTPNFTDIYSVQTDYTKGFKNRMLIRGGLKYASTKRDNEVRRDDLEGNEWVLNTGLSNRFIYKESLLMGYASAEGSFNKMSIKAGLRAEETFVNGHSLTSGERFSKDYFGLFPSVFITRNLNETKGNSISFSYARRLQRPAFNDLNPYRLQFDTYMVKTGNPDLLPQYTHNFQFSFDFLHDYSTGIYFSRTTDVIGELANPTDDNVIEYQSRNLSNSTEYGFNLSAPVKITKWWATNNDFSFFHLNYMINEFENKNTSFSVKSSHTLTFKNNIEGMLYAEYQSPFARSNSRIDWIFFVDVGVAKRLLNKKGRITFYITDILNTFREQDVTKYNNTRIDFYQKRPTRTASLSFSYSLSTGKKFNNKKIDESNKEEKSRIGN